MGRENLEKSVRIYVLNWMMGDRMPSKTIRASEIGLYLYCERAWWYHRQGVESTNQVEMLTGTELHRQHGRSMLTTRLVRTAASIFLLVALMALAAYCTSAVLP